MGLGPLETVTLAAARVAAHRARTLLADGVDPIAERRTRERSVPLFRGMAHRYVQSHRSGWSNAKHARQWLRTLEVHAFPVVGSLPVDAIETSHVMRVLQPLWTSKPETAARLRGRIEKILDSATVQGHRTGPNPARWRGHLEALLPARSRVRTVTHHRALSWREVPEFMARLRQQVGIAARACELLVLCAARSGEVRFATWSEFDMDARVWTVPAGRMKTRREHRVPLAGDAVDLLRALPREADLVFPSTVNGGPLRSKTLRSVVEEIGADATVHGFRSSFRDWCAESTAYPRELAEQALAHAVGNAVEAAYRRGDLFDKRRKLMTEWASYCGSEPAERAGVVPIGAAR